MENVELKKSLEKEEFLHKTLYKQWNELNARMSAKERELEQYKSRNNFYKYAFFSILFLAAPAYYFLSGTKQDDKVEPSPKISQPIVTTNQPVKQTIDTIQLPAAKQQKTEIARVDTTQLKTPVIQVSQRNNQVIVKNNQAIQKSNEVIEKPLSDAVRGLIYSEGWDAYHEKSTNPYPKSSQKYRSWLNGWKDAEADEKRTLTTTSPNGEK
jgi:ribosome modulation factor